MAWLADTMLQPQSGWVFKEERTGVPLTAGNYVGLLETVARHRRINKLEQGDVEADVNQYLCAHNPPNFCQGMRGLGDVIARVTSALGITPCAGCKQRQASLNQAVPFAGKKQ